MATKSVYVVTYVDKYDGMQEHHWRIHAICTTEEKAQRVEATLKATRSNVCMSSIEEHTLCE